jgi:septum formation protein
MMPTMRLILASASPSRLRLLRAAGIDPEVVVSTVDEDAVVEQMAEPTPEQVALHLAEAKARDVGTHYPGRLVLGADSVLDVDGRSLGKPLTPAVAIQRWHEIRGRSADLITGHALVHPGGVVIAAARTTVHFARPDDDEIAAYVATGEPLSVAGGFTLDGYGSAFVSGVEGDPANVIGLGIPLLRTMVREAGLRWTDLWWRAGPESSVGHHIGGRG